MTLILEILNAAERDGMSLEDAFDTHDAVCNAVKRAEKLRAAMEPAIEAAREAAEGGVPEVVIRATPELRLVLEMTEHCRDLLKNAVTEPHRLPEMADAMKRATHDLETILSRFDAAIAARKN